MLPSARATLEIGAAGPLAGFVVALPLLLVGFALSEVRAIDLPLTVDVSSPFALVRALLEGRSLSGGGGALQSFGDSLLTWGARPLVLGDLPPGHDVILHPVAFAAWLGLLVTTLNLVPLGQLDGGHVLYALLGRRRALVAGRYVSAALFAAGIFWSWNWLLWGFLSRFVLGLRHPPTLLEEPLDPKRRAIAWLSLALFVATFVPVPVSF
jgi:membrane-associated protease RseP (regulator of RpoE activity)